MKSVIIRRAINSYKTIENMNIGWYDLLEESLSTETKNIVDSSGINLHVLAVIIKQTMQEAEDKADIDRIFNEKLHNQDLIFNLIAKYCN